MLIVFSLLKALGSSRFGTGTQIDVEEAQNRSTGVNSSQSQRVIRTYSLNNIRLEDRCGDLILILNKNQELSLINLITYSTLWSIKIQNRGGYDDQSWLEKPIKVYQDGYAVFITKKCKTYEPLHSKDDYNIQIFLDGIKVGDFIISEPFFELSSLKMVNGRVLGMVKSYSNANFYEWDIQGNLIRTIPLKKMRSIGIHPIGVACGDRYYVASQESKDWGKGPLFFVFDLETNEGKIFDLIEPEGHVNLIYLHKDKLICAISYNGENPLNDNIRVYNLKTGNVEEEYTFAQGKMEIVNVIANDDFIVFCSYLHYRRDNAYLYSIDRKNGQIKQIKVIPPECFGKRLALSLDENCLTILRKDKVHSVSCLTIDLDAEETLGDEITYQCRLSHLTSFESGKLALFTEDDASLYVVDFRIASNKEPDETRSLHL